MKRGNVSSSTALYPLCNNPKAKFGYLPLSKYISPPPYLVVLNRLQTSPSTWAAFSATPPIHFFAAPHAPSSAGDVSKLVLSFPETPTASAKPDNTLGRRSCAA